MANTFAPFGFAQYFGDGATPTYELVPRQVALDAGAIYSGDPVTSQASGTIARASAGTTQIAGIFYGCSYVSATLNRKVWSPYWPGSGAALANTVVTAFIANDPNARFLVQSGTAAAVDLTGVGANINFALGTGNALSGQSGAYADQSTIDPATTTLPFRIWDLVTFPPGSNGTDTSSAGNFIVVGFNNVDTRVLTGQ